MSAIAIYTGATATTSIAGYYKLHFIAEGITGTVDFNREALASVAVTASNAVLGSTFTVAKVDSNANGVADLLRVAVSVTTNVAGEFSLVGTLSDSLGNKVSASTIVALQVGGVTVNLDFDGKALFANGVDGPFSIGDIALFEHGALSLRPARTSSIVIVTDPYSHFEFEHESPIRLVGPGASEGLFLDVDGFYDMLRVRLPVHADRNSTYRWSADLTDSAGVLMTTAGAEASLAAGADTLVLDFPGFDIGTHGVDGKYEVRDLWVGGGGGTLSQALAHTTEYFLSDQFSPGSETTPKVRVFGTFVYNDSLLGANSSVLFPRIVVYDTKDRCAGCDSTALQPVAYSTVSGPGGGFQVGPIPNVDRDDDNGPLDLLVRVYYQRGQTGVVGSTARQIVSLVDSTGELWHFDAPLQENVASGELFLGELRPTDPGHLAALHILNTLGSGAGPVDSTAWTWAVRRFGVSSDSILPVTVIWSPGYSVSPGTKGTKYDKATRALYVDGRSDTLSYSPDAWDDTIVLREFAHHIGYTIGLNSAHAGVIPSCEAQADSSAWDEGFAHFYASYLQSVRGQSFVQTDFGVDPSGTQNERSFNIETGCSSPVCPAGCENSSGPANARAVAGALWDLYDSAHDNPNGDAFGDSLSDGSANIYTVVAHAQTPIRSVLAFRDAYIDMTARRDANFRRHWLVRQIFFEHGIDYNLTNADGPALAPRVLTLYPSRPNPFNPRTRISFGLPVSSHVRLSIFDVQGRRVRSLLNQAMPPGVHEVIWDGRGQDGREVASGVYYCRLDTAAGKRSIKLVLAR